MVKHFSYNNLADFGCTDLPSDHLSGCFDSFFEVEPEFYKPKLESATDGFVSFDNKL